MDVTADTRRALASDGDLTVILTLRGRHLHTLRWMWHANRTAFPYHVIIADGDVHPAIDHLLSDPTTFPNLSYEYHRHDDRTFSDFYRKCVETVKKVRSRYVMLSDNDDFTIVAGIRRSIDYLDAEPDYVCAGGRIPDFTLLPRADLPGNVIGSTVRVRFGYKQKCRDIAFPAAHARVMEEVDRYQVVYYSAFRTSALRTIFEEVEAHDFSNLVVHEFFVSLRAATLGKIRLDPAVICYLRQTGTSLQHTYTKDWVSDLLRGKLPQDYRAMAAAITGAVEKADGAVSSAFSETILDAYSAQLRHMLAHTMLRYRFPRLFRLKQKLQWLRELHVLPPGYRRRRALRAFWKDLAKDCTDPALLAAYREEFAAIEASVRGDAFLRFVNDRAPDL